MAPTPSTKSNLSTTPSSKSHHSRAPSKRLHYTTGAAASAPPEHPVEVIGRIRNHTEPKVKPNTIIPSSLHINTDGKSLRVKTEFGYRNFSLDGVSSSEEDDLDGFYQKYVESRINGVKLGNKCTIMMYGPTGSGKSHTMFGCSKKKGIVYKSLKDILGDEDEDEENGEKLRVGTFVQVSVLEIYNEEIYDLLSTGISGGGFSLGWPKSNSKVKLEVMGKKAKNATFISGNEAGKILKEVQKVEKRRIVKSTLCNERSSRSHCLIIVDVPTVGGQLMLVDMAGSENIEQAGQIGFEAKMQTAKINQGNIALKRVVESIANGDSHVPFRDSKLTMLLQDSFEDDKSKILMILCASPDMKELHKTIATLEYGAKAKCIVRGPQTPIKDNGEEDSSSAVILGSRIAALDEFIHKLQSENKLKEKERNEAKKELKKKEDEVSILRAKLAIVEQRGKEEPNEEEINSKVNERTQMLKRELESKIQECEKMANEVVEMERKKMEEKMFQQQQEVQMLKARLEEVESQLRLSRRGSSESLEMEGSGFMKRFLEVSSDDSDMVKSMDIDRSIDLETTVVTYGNNTSSFSEGRQSITPNKALLTTVYEEEDEYENDEEDKEVIEEKKMIVTNNETENSQDESSSRELRIQNIFTLCGNYRELPKDDVLLDISETEQKLGENELHKLNHDNTVDDVEVYVKWEASKENAGQFITTLKVPKDSTLADLRKLIEIHFGGGDEIAFTFLVLGDPSGAPVPKEKESAALTTKLPICNNGHLACLRQVNPIIQRLPFSSLENKLLVDITSPESKFTKKSDSLFSSPMAAQELTPFGNLRRY